MPELVLTARGFCFLKKKKKLRKSPIGGIDEEKTTGDVFTGKMTSTVLIMINITSSSVHDLKFL